MKHNRLHSVLDLVADDERMAHIYNVTQYLDDLSTRLDLYQIEETMFVFYLKNAPEEVVAKLT
jgi:hypothetical protein